MERPPLPGPLRHVALTPFVGRSRELEILGELLPRSPDAGQRVVLVGGEPGSGKSRLVKEFAQSVAGHGVLVLHGACDAVVPTPFRPFVEALEQLVRVTDPAVLRAALGPSGGELARLLDLEPHVGELPPPVAADPDTERHRLHSAVGDLFVRVGDRQPVLLVVEDCHWADTPTLMLLRHLAKAHGNPRLLVLATFRDNDADVPAELADALADLRRSDDVVRIGLEGLNEEDVAEFVQRSSGGEADAVDPELVASLHKLTEGNAFLLCELWRNLDESGWTSAEGGTVQLLLSLQEIAAPEGVREVVNQRALRLDPATRDMLELAATVGAEISLGVIADAAAPGTDMGGALEAAVAIGMIEEVPSETIAYRFTHELVRLALYDQLSALRRAELHLRVAKALEATAGTGGSRVLAELAYHYTQAIPIGRRDRAVDYNIAAAAAAAGALDHGEAVKRLETAVRLGIDDERRRAEVQVSLGTELDRAGDSLRSLAAFREAAEIARGVGDAEIFARAAIGFENTCWRPGLRGEGAVAILEEALVNLPEEDSSLRVGVLAGFARTLDMELGDHERAAGPRDEAVRMARRLEDRRGLANVLVRAYWSDLPRPEVLAMLDEGRELAAGLGDVELEAHAAEWRICTLMVMGDIEAAKREQAAVQESARRTRQPFMLHVAEHYSSALSLLTGHLDAAESAAERSREWGSLLTGRDASGIYGIQMFGVRREQGRLGELAPVVAILARGEGASSWRPGWVTLLAELGMDEEVRSELDEMCREGLEGLRASLWLAALTYLTEASAAAGHEGMAELLYPELAPLSGGLIMIGHGVGCYGAADRYLGMLAATLGDYDVASAHFEAALELDRSMGARTWVAHGCYEYGRALKRQGEPARAEPLLSEAMALAESVGMPTLQGRLQSLGRKEPTAVRLPDKLSGREGDVLRLVARGRSNREIGAALHISENTAANHVRSILRKTGCANRTEATAYAYRHGLAES